MTTGHARGPEWTWARLSRWIGLALAVALLAGCGGAGSGSGAGPVLPSRTGTLRPTATPSLPAPSRSRPSTSSAPVEPSTSSAPVEPSTSETSSRPTSPTSPARTTSAPTSAPTKTTGENPTPSDTLSTSPTASSSTTPSPSEEPASTGSTGTPSWVWWLLGALVVAAAVAIPLLVRASKRRRWRAELAEAEGEVGWFARVLLPGLQVAASPAEVRGGWGVGQARVAAVEDRLTALAASAPDDAGQTRAVDAARRRPSGSGTDRRARGIREGGRDARAGSRRRRSDGRPRTADDRQPVAHRTVERRSDGDCSGTRALPQERDDARSIIYRWRLA